MAEGRAHPQHTVAVPNERWDGFGEVAERLGTDRSKLLNLCMAWYRREPDVVLPRRPPLTPPPAGSGT